MSIKNSVILEADIEELVAALGYDMGSICGIELLPIYNEHATGPKLGIKVRSTKPIDGFTYSVNEGWVIPRRYIKIKKVELEDEQ